MCIRDRIFSDEIIEQLIDLIMEAQQQENTRLPVLKDQLLSLIHI